jgi:hypothetical protein
MRTIVTSAAGAASASHSAATVDRAQVRMDNHTVAGIVIVIALLSGFAMFYERDFRARRDRAKQRKRMRQRAKEREQG